MGPVGTVRFLLRLQFRKQTGRFSFDFFIGKRRPQMLLPAYLVQKEVGQAGIAGIHHKLNITVIALGVRILKHRDGPGPILIGAGNAPVPILFPDCSGKDIERPVHAESVNDL